MNPIIKARRVEAVFAVVSADYPHLFNPDNPVPLKIGIRQDLHAVYEGRISHRKIGDFMCVWAALPKYVEARDSATCRYGLDGKEYPVQ